VSPLYLDTARLLIQVAPLVFADGAFALKGGTAINLFMRDMPRLSVDLDLVFTDHRMPRDQALQRIDEALRQAAARLNARGFQTRTRGAAGGLETKLIVRRGSMEVKVEVNFVMRGTVHSVRNASLATRARDLLMADVELPLASLEDVYGGKLVTAMDRQHPRDLFDIMQLFEHEGITPGIRRAFVVYLASHNRPVHEVLFPAERDIAQEYERTFQGMTADTVELADLLRVRKRMMVELPGSLDPDERRFLLSLVNNRPDWPLLKIPHADELPGIRWKLNNLGHLQTSNPKKFNEQREALARLLG
jgi:hypothetical protein